MFVSDSLASRVPGLRLGAMVGTSGLGGAPGSPANFERMTPRMIPTVLQYDVCMAPCLRWRPALAVDETAEEGMTSERAMSPRKSAPNFISTGGNRTASTYLTDRRSSQA